MAQTQPWYRYYTETPDDLKLKRAALMAGCERVIINGVWSAVMTMAKESPVEGSLLIAKNTPASIEEIADKAGTANIQLLDKILDAFVQLDMVHFDGRIFSLPHWHERQYKSDSSTPRVRAHRARKGNGAGNAGGNVSPETAGNGPETEADKDAEEEADGASASYPASSEIILYREVTGIAPDYTTGSRIEEKIQALRQKLGNPPRDQLKTLMLEKYSLWCNATTKDGRPYSPSNPDWLDWCATGYIPKPPATPAPPKPERRPIEVWQ